MAEMDRQFSALGIAQVIVVLKSAPPIPVAARIAAGGILPRLLASALPEVASLDECFASSELSINHALASAASATIALTVSRVSARRAPAQAPPSVLHFPNLGLMLGTVNREGLSSLRKHSMVDKVVGAPQPRLIKPVRAAATKLKTDITWGIQFMNIPRLWAQGLTGNGIRVGHLDTGADGTHASLRKAIATFAEFDSFGQLVTPTPKAHDTGEHGTHTAATIAGRPVGGKSIGVAPGADLVSGIVLEGGNVIARILGGMDWAVSQNVRLLNMSLGIPLSPPMPEFEPVLKILRSRNILPILAVGNEGPGTSRAPGNQPESVSVGAIDKKTAIAAFSSSQRFNRKEDPLVPDLVAPGVDIISAMPGRGYQSMDGSSMASPHISGLAALLLEAKPTATIDEIENAIYRSCSVGTIPTERGNRGVPDAVRAFEELTGTPLPKTAVKPSKGASKAAKKSKASKTSKAKQEKSSGKKTAKSKGAVKNTGKSTAKKKKTPKIGSKQNRAGSKQKR